MCCGGHAEAAKAVSLASLLHLASCLSCCVCLLMGRAPALRSGATPSSRGCPNPQQPSLRWQPSSLPQPAHPGTARGAWQPPRATCVPGRQRAPQLGDGRRDAGSCHSCGASCNCGASRGRCPTGLSGIAWAGLRHISLGAEALPRGSRWVPGGDAAWVARCPGQPLRLPLLARPLSDRHIGAAPGGRGSPGRGHREAAGDMAVGPDVPQVCTWQFLAVACLAPCWGAGVCRGQVMGAGGWCGQLLPRERDREPPAAAQGCWEQAAGLRYRVSVSLVMGPAGCRPPPGAGNGGSGAQAARRGGDRSWDAALALQGCAEG